jgi:hypothetical protein
LLAFVPVVFVAQKLEPEAHTVLFVLSALAIVPLAALLSHATESVAVKTGDAVGGLLNATLGNLTELVIARRTKWSSGKRSERARERDPVMDSPAEFASLLSSVVVLVEHGPPADEPDLLGLYEVLNDRACDANIRALCQHTGISPPIVFSGQTNASHRKLPESSMFSVSGPPSARLASVLLP